MTKDWTLKDLRTERNKLRAASDKAKYASGDAFRALDDMLRGCPLPEREQLTDAFRRYQYAKDDFLHALAALRYSEGKRIGFAQGKRQAKKGTL
jgi:hypothetical protein